MKAYSYKQIYLGYSTSKVTAVNNDVLHSRYIFHWEFLLCVRDEHTCLSNHAIADGRNFNRPVSRRHPRFFYKIKAR